MLVGQTIGSGPYRFEVESELGSGAMGTVYKAKFHKDGKVVPVALKIVALGLVGNENAMARFERESAILKQLRHPHIVKLYATGAYRKTPFIAMEFVDGEPLDRILARRGRLGWEEVVAYGKQLCQALQYAHEKGIIHRDLKPSNLMITPEGTLKLTDFGIAKDTDVTALTGQNSTIGTAAYMSPEQCKGDRNLTPKSDLYSLGIVFFELLTGKKPFYADTTVDMFLKHVNEKPPRVGKLVNELPTKLEALVLQLLEKDKEDRPVDAAWVGRMLLEVEEDAYARKSAGLVAATNKRTDKPRNADGSRLDDEDRDAARALQGKKKKKKKKAVPLLEQKWVKATGILLALGVMAGGAYWALKPPSAESLVRAIDSAESPEARLEAAKKYLEKYGQQPGEATDKAAAVFREVTTRKREEVLARRFNNDRFRNNPEESDDPEAYNAAMQAIQAEQAGQLKLATEFWGKVKARFPDEARLPFALQEERLAKARWAWVAEKRLADLGEVEQLSKKLEDQIKDKRNHEVPFSADVSSPEALAIRGLRLEQFGDAAKAGRTWESLAALTEKEPEKREWYLLACWRRTQLPKPPADPVAARVATIQKQLGEAEVLAAAARGKADRELDRIRVRNQCREVADLYDDEADATIKALVKRARDIAATVPKS
jgi:serine/threonine-protein kinase